MIWMVLPETFSLLTRRAATPMPDSSSIGGTSMEVLFCTTSPRIDSGSMSRMRLRFFFRTTWRLTTICGKTTVEASGMIGSSAGMSHSSSSADGRMDVGVAFSLAARGSAGPLPFAAVMGTSGAFAALCEESVGDHLVDELRHQEIAGRVVRDRSQLVDVEPHERLPPAQGADEFERLVPSGPSRLRSAGRRQNRRIEVIDVNRKVYLVGQVVNLFQGRLRAPEELLSGDDPELLFGDETGLLLAVGADADLEGGDAPRE